MVQSSEVSTKYFSEYLSENSEESFPSDNSEELNVRRNLPRDKSSSELSEDLHSLGILKKIIFLKNLFFFKINFIFKN